MRTKLLWCAALVFALGLATALLPPVLSEKKRDSLQIDDEVGLAELPRFAKAVLSFFVSTGIYSIFLFIYKTSP